LNVLAFLHAHNSRGSGWCLPKQTRFEGSNEEGKFSPPTTPTQEMVDIKKIGLDFDSIPLEVAEQVVECVRNWTKIVGEDAESRRK